MTDFLLELFSEEIPARLQQDACRQLHQRFHDLLEQAGLSAKSVEVQVTPRRLALLARGLPGRSAAVVEERRGPRVGAPEKALEGFLRSTGLTQDDLEQRETDKGQFYFATIHYEGESSADLLEARLPALIEGFDWPKSQRWGEASISTSSPRWIRPLRSIIALFGREVLEFEALGITASNETHGHRFMGGRDPIAIDSPGSYENQLQAAFVQLSVDERQKAIASGARRAARKAGWRLRESDALVAENAGLTEWPVALAGKFDADFLQVPAEIIELTMATNQKYFVLEDEAGNLAPGFVCVANLEAPDGGEAIIAGNERVLSARLADARFFWEQDKASTLQEFAGRLGQMVFHERLGSMADKVGRTAHLARFLVERFMPDADAALAERAARLARADLMTGTVGEFPELQGVIGGHLARFQGEDAAVVDAISQFYAPCPQGDLAVAIAMADRLDSISGFFAAGIRPSGSRDPFALRRAAMGILDMLIAERRRMALRPLLAEAGAKDADEVIGFLADRLKVRERAAGVRHDLVDAVFALGDEDDLVRLLDRVHALQEFVETPDGGNLLAGYRRAANILKAEEKKAGTRFELDDNATWSADAEPAEQALAARLGRDDDGQVQLFREVEARLEAEDFAGAMRHLATLRDPVDRFFEDVKVNADDPATRLRRLGLLAGLRSAMHRVADFSRIEG